MIRSTINATIKTITRAIAGHPSQSREHTYGSSNGILDPAAASITEAEYEAATNNTYAIVHSNEHWDGTTITR